MPLLVLTEAVAYSLDVARNSVSARVKPRALVGYDVIDDVCRMDAAADLWAAFLSQTHGRRSVIAHFAECNVPETRTAATSA